MSENHKRPGRPPLKPGESSTSINVRIPVSDYDRACRVAIRQDRSVAEVLRRGLRRECDNADDE
jgi:predicted HicB family RNase H-like nuclease